MSKLIFYHLQVKIYETILEQYNLINIITIYRVATNRLQNRAMTVSMTVI